MKRRHALALFATAPLIHACAPFARGIRVGSKNFTESIVLAELYAQALERAQLPVVRRFNLGSTQIVMEAMARNDIDLYPEYTGTALVDVLHLPPQADPATILSTVRSAFQRDYGFVWLDQAPMNDSQGLATTPEVSARYGMRTLTELATLAPQLRLATIPEFVSRPDGLPGLQKLYGGFRFKTVHVYDIALKYDALLAGQADVATAFTTDGTIAAHHLVVLQDDKHLWPPYHAAPVARPQVLKAYPRAAPALNAISARISSEAMQRMNQSVEAGADPADVARTFVAKALA